MNTVTNEMNTMVIKIGETYIATHAGLKPKDKTRMQSIYETVSNVVNAAKKHLNPITKVNREKVKNHQSMNNEDNLY